MDPRLKESISALMDDEANELELQRVLSQLDQSEVKEVWQRYHLIREVMSGREHGVAMQAGQALPELDVSATVAAAIASEEAGHDLGSPKNRIAIKPLRWLGMGGVAASLLVVAIFIGQKQDGSVESELIASGTEQVPEQAVGHERQPKMVANLSERQLQRFNEYLLRHAEHSLAYSGQGLMPLARVASVNAVGI